jgi:uncharacterized protein (TIGR03067 family)
MKFMMTTLISLATSLALAATLAVAAEAAASADKKPAARDQDALQGKWGVKSQEVGGRLSPDEAEEVRLEFDGAKLKLMRGDQAIAAGTFTIDASQQPKRLDLSVTLADEPGVEGKTVHGIYELKGDTLKWCTTQPGSDDRPSNFETKETQHMMVTCERQKAKK